MYDDWTQRAGSPIINQAELAAAIENQEPIVNIITVFMIFLAPWQFAFNISNKAMNLLIKFFYKFIDLLANFIANDRLCQLQN